MIEKEKSIEVPKDVFLVTEEMAGEIGRAVSGLSQGEILQVANILRAIASGEGKGTAVLKAVGYGRYSQFLDLLERVSGSVSFLPSPSGSFSFRERSVSYDHSVAKVFERAREIANGLPISTGDFVLAETGLKNSLLIKALTEACVPEPVAENIRTTFEIVEENEKGSVEIGNVVVPVVASENIQFDQPQERVDFLPRSGIVDLIREAKEGKFKDLVIRPKWVSELLGNVETQTLSVLVCDQENASMIVLGLADQLAKDGGRTFAYQKIVAIDPMVLETNSAEVIANAIVLAKKGVLYLPGLQRFLKAGSQENLYLRRAMASGQVRLVGSVSEKQWRAVRNEEVFQEVRPIFPEPPTIEETQKIILAKRKDLENNLSRGGIVIEITSQAIETACKLAHRYCRDFPLPSSAVMILTRAAAETRLSASRMEALHDQRIKGDTRIDSEDVAVAAEKMIGIKITVEDPERYLAMEKELQRWIINQDEAISAVSDIIRKAKAGLNDPNRPLGSFMFMGPSGVGKTELAKTLAGFLFGSGREMIVLDMSEFGEKHNVARLIGAPPGYIGYEEGGQLTEAVKKKPYSVVVLDEIEKAHPEVLSVLLQILEEGRLTDGQGRTIDFTQTVVIMTGNVGSKYFMAEEKVGREKVVAAVDEEIKEVFRPEFLNRIDNLVIFNTLWPEHLLPIVDIQLRKVNDRLKEKGLVLELTDEAKKSVAEKGYDPVYGARPLRREIEKLNAALAREMLAGKYQAGDKILADYIEGKIVFSKVEKPVGQ